jgi:hypothetical protein
MEIRKLPLSETKIMVLGDARHAVSHIGITAEERTSQEPIILTLTAMRTPDLTTTARFETSCREILTHFGIGKYADK